MKNFSLYFIITLLFSSIALANSNEDLYRKMQKDIEEFRSNHAIKMSFETNDENNHYIKLFYEKNNKPITWEMLKDNNHKGKLNLMIFETSLNEYFQIFPEKTERPGVFKFKWRPSPNNCYVLWSEFTLKKGGTEKANAFVNYNQVCPEFLDMKESLEFETKRYKFKLIFEDKKKLANKNLNVYLHITDLKNKPVSKLVRFNGDYAHITLISGDLKEFSYFHPVRRPSSVLSLSGPDIPFILNVTEPGFYKLYAQVKISNNIYAVPFVFKVD